MARAHAYCGIAPCGDPNDIQGTSSLAAAISSAGRLLTHSPTAFGLGSCPNAICGKSKILPRWRVVPRFGTSSFAPSFLAST